MADLHLRRLAIFVDEPDPGCFYWVLIESTEDAAIWDDIESSEHAYCSWKEAWDAGNAHLLAMVADHATGPLAAGEDETASPVGTLAG